jgi:hypothetical protein
VRSVPLATANKDRARAMIIERLKVAFDSLSLWERVRERAYKVEK